MIGLWALWQEEQYEQPLMNNKREQDFMDELMETSKNSIITNKKLLIFSNIMELGYNYHCQRGGGLKLMGVELKWPTAYSKEC